MSVLTDTYLPKKIVFPHIMKTGGTTIVEQLQYYYDNESVLFEASTHNELQDVVFKRIDSARFVRGHFDLSILDVFGHQNGFNIIALLRDPISRVVSHYFHLMSAPDIDPAYLFLRKNKLSLEDFLNSDLCIEFTSNYQVRQYGSRGSSNLTEDNLTSAKFFIDKCAVIGVTEDLEGFAEKLRNFLNIETIKADLSINRSYSKPIELSDDLISQIKKLNKLDIELYEYVIEKISKESVKKEERINPVSANVLGDVNWLATQPFIGFGWSDTQKTDIPHRWSKANESIFLLKNEFKSDVLCFLSINRFVIPEQEKSLFIYINNEIIKLKRIDISSLDGYLFVFKIAKTIKPKIEIKFCMDKLISFNEIKSDDKSKKKYGFALSQIFITKEMHVISN